MCIRDRMWVFEAVPAWTTSVLIVVLLLLTVSDSSLWFLTPVSYTHLLFRSIRTRYTPGVKSGPATKSPVKCPPPVPPVAGSL